LALIRLRSAAAEGAFDLGLFEEKSDYRPAGRPPAVLAEE
jgi:hypothetical protein